MLKSAWLYDTTAWTDATSNWTNAIITAGTSNNIYQPSAEVAKPGPETPLAWLDRRVAEVSVSL